MINLEELFNIRENKFRPLIELIASFAAFLIPFFLTFVVQNKFSFPDILTNAPVIFPVIAGTFSLYLVSKKFFDTNLKERFGLRFNADFLKDLSAGVIFGAIFQGLITAATLQTGSAELISIFSFETSLALPLWLIAFSSTVLGFLCVAFYEELLFRGVLIKNTAEGIYSKMSDERTSIFLALLIGPVMFGIPHIFAVAEGASPIFAIFQASVAALYFGIGYILTDRVALPIGLHFISNFWFVSIFGGTENGFPALARIDRTLNLGVDAIFEFIFPVFVLIGLIWAYAKIYRNRNLTDFIQNNE